jgi:hypothetical protein
MLTTIMTVVAVIPTIRPEQCKLFLESWREEFSRHVDAVILVEDSPKKTFTITNYPVDIYHYSWKDIDKDLGKDAWIIPRRTDCVRSYGFLKAKELRAEIILTLDDDTVPKVSFRSSDTIAEHKNQIYVMRSNSSYVDVGKFLSGDSFMRGYPFSHRRKDTPVVASYGMWNGVADLDGITQLALKPSATSSFWTWSDGAIVPKYAAFTGCIMNVAFKVEALPCMYQLLMGKDHRFDRWGDIWSGLFLKRCLDIVNSGVVCINGKAVVDHDRLSNVAKNIEKEASGYAVNEVMWDKLMRFQSSKTTLAEVYVDLAEFIRETDLFNDKDYSNKVSKAMIVWVRLTK